jgi:hypothetical protein
MTNESHNYNQLIELAVLDAHGLLEPIETDLFNRSFHDAPASVQNEIIQLQLDFARDETLLPSDSPASELKTKVLRTVAMAADKEAQRLAPLALIGARASSAKAQFGHSKQPYYWRIAALILFGVTVVLGIVAVDAQRRATSIAQVAMDLDATTTLSTIAGEEFKSFIDNPYCRVTRLERETGSQDGYLRVAVNERYGGGYILGLDLVDGEEIIIQGTTATGELIELARFTANSSVVGRSFAIDKTIAKGISVTAIDARTGNRWI